jgi:ComF family protein
MSTFPNPRQLWSGFLQLIYPELCVSCGNDLPYEATCFCFRCKSRLSVSDMYKCRENEFVQRLWGRLPLEGGAAAYYFTRQSPIRHAIHHLKYRNKPEIGLILGREFGRKLRQAEGFQTIDAIIPVPLHPKKERLRGYNQSTMFAQGLSEAMNLPLWNGILVRNTHSDTQTHKKRMERFQNVDSLFGLRKPQLLEGKHILLADDVLTTGATLEICGHTLLQAKGTRLSCATIAIAAR